MYVQLLDGGITPETRDELELAIRDRLLPVLREQEGFCGALHLLDRDACSTMMIVCWETEEQALRPLELPCQRLEAALSGRASVWEVTQRA